MAQDNNTFPDLQTAARLLGGRVSNGQVLAPGPGHSAADESLSVKPDPNAPGGFIVNSFAGNDPIACKDYVREKLGLPAFKPNGGNHRIDNEIIIKAVMQAALGQGRAKSTGKVVAEYNYTNASGELLYQVVRLEPKDFRQRRPDGNGGWIWKLTDQRVLYRWPELIKFPDATIYVTEGEKDADRVARLNLCATTVAAGVWTKDCIHALTGRDVVILEDNDDAGRKKSLEAATALHGVAYSIRIVRLPHLPEKGDVSDWLDANRADKFCDVCFDAPVWTPSESDAEAAATPPQPQPQLDGDAKPELLMRINNLNCRPGSTILPMSGESECSNRIENVSPLLRPYSPRPFTSIQRRQWLHAGHYIRKHVVMTVAPGGYGKTSLILCNAIEMGTATGLIGPAPPEALRVAYWNGEDPDDEIERRIAALCIRHNIDQAWLQGQLFLGSKITGGRRIASLNRHGNVVCEESMLSEVTGFVTAEKIDCLIFDPLIAFHRVPENNNAAMEQVIKDAFEGIAENCNCCVELSQHTRKPQINQELTVDDSRGGGAITNAARSVRILNRMTAKEAELPKIADEERRLYLRTSRDKANMVPPTKANWIRLVSVELPNGDGSRPGDQVQAVEQWDYPQPFANVSTDDMQWLRDTVRGGEYRNNSRSLDWVGIPLAQRLHLDLDDKGDRAKVVAILKKWFQTGVLATETRKDSERHDREYVVPGDWNEASE